MAVTGQRRLLYVPCKLTEIRKVMPKSRMHRTCYQALYYPYSALYVTSSSSPMNINEKNAFIQSLEKIVQPTVTSLPLEIKYLPYLDQPNILQWKTQKMVWTHWCRFAFQFSARRKSPSDRLCGISIPDQGCLLYCLDSRSWDVLCASHAPGCHKPSFFLA